MNRFIKTAGLLVAVPFPLLMWATDATISTEVARNGAGYQKVSIAFPEERAKPVERTRDIQKAYPRKAGWSEPSARRRGGDIVFTTDKRRGGIGRYEGASLERTGRWYSLWTHYHFRQQVAVMSPPEYEERAASPVLYRLKMPGTTVGSNAASSLTGKNVWLEWEVPAGQEPVTIDAESKVFRCGYATLLIFLALWALGWGLRSFLRWRRAQPKRI